MGTRPGSLKPGFVRRFAGARRGCLKTSTFFVYRVSSERNSTRSDGCRRLMLQLNGELIVRVDLPGLNKDDVKVD